MLDRRTVLLSIGLGLAAPRPAAADPPSEAEQAILDALAQAVIERKGLLIEYHASWCAWCRPMQALLTDPQVAPILQRRFRILRMQALERTAARRAEQLAGADETLDRYGGPAVGLPFLVFLNPKGEVLAASNTFGESFGFPASPEELNAFDSALRRADPRITQAERDVLRARCVAIYRGASRR